MKENLTDLTPMGDEALEARIIAWVLGEASAFEAAELESLCEQYPEWRVFQRRMLALHDCLQEVHAPVAADDWKLSAEKRGKLDEVLGKQDITSQVQRKSQRHWWVHVAGIAAVLVMLAAIGTAALGTMGKVGKGVAFKTSQERVAYSAESPSVAAFGSTRKSFHPPAPGNFPVSPATPSDEAVDPFAASEPMPSETRPPASNQAARPSAPSASAQVIAGAPPAAIAMPTPAVDGKSASTRYGSGDDLGEGWGGQGLAKGEKKANVATEEQQSNGVAVWKRVSGGDVSHAYSLGDLRAPADSASDNSAVIAGKKLSDVDADERKKMLEEVDRAWSLTGEKGAAAAKPTGDFEGGGGGGMTAAEFQEMEKAMAEGQDKNTPQAERGRERRDALQPAAGAAQAADSAVVVDSIGSNQDLPLQEGQKGDEVSRALNKAEGNTNLGKYDEAAREYEEVLRVDPYNKSARSGLERVSAAKSDYYRSAYDQTRAELLTDVDKAWELDIPNKGDNAVDPLMNELTPAPAVEEKTQELAKAAVQSPVVKQKEAALVLSELSAEQDPYSTFSLRVSDNAFRIAQAAMAQGQRPAAESVRIEEFYNAFDYGDPVPTAQEPVAASIEQSAHPILPQRNLLRIGLRTAASGRGAGQPLHLTLLIDQSGSMSRGDRSAALTAAVRELGTLLQAKDQISVIGFSRTPRLLAENIPGDQPQRLLELLARTPSDGGTNLEEALKLGEIVAKRNELAGAQNRLLLLTDGAANLGNADPDRLAAWVKALRQKNIAFDIAGIGTDGLNDPLLVEIARHGNGRYYVINDAAQAKQQFATQLAGAFRPSAENVKVQVQFNPKRVGKYQLVGFEKDRLNTEDFRNDQVDAAEMAAAEAGQALYQVELLPDGVGDIGEVSVRFRDVATRQMVERKWTIRYDATTAVFERAAPTMQLAGLAMLTAQKLQGGPAAPMIRFSEMPQAQQQIRDGFSQSPRVAELLEMIRQLND